jgi:hypothetical protein
MFIPHNCDPGEGFSATFALPIASDDEGAIGVSLTANAHAACVALEDAGLD